MLKKKSINSSGFIFIKNKKCGMSLGHVGDSVGNKKNKIKRGYKKSCKLSK